MKKTGLIVAVIVVIALAAWGYTSLNKKQVAEPGSDPIKIGYFGPFTGPVAGSSGETIANGWKLAVASRPVLARRNVEVIYEDDACDPKKAAAAAQKLITVDKVNILVNGVCSGSMLAAAPIAEASKVILFTPVSTSPKITTAGDYIFRTSGTGETIAQVINARITALGYKKIGLLVENAEYPIGIRDSFLKNINATSGQEIIAQETINPNEVDMRSQLTKLIQAKPDVLVVVMNSTVTANGFVKQSKELGVTVPVIANEYFTFSDVVANPNADGIFATLYKYDGKSPLFTALISKYEKEYGKKPGQELYVALPYDGYNVLADAIEKCNGDNPDCLRDELYKVSDYPGLAGVISIDSNGDTNRASMITQIKNKTLIVTQ